MPQTGPSAADEVRKQKDDFMFLTYANIVYTTQYDVWGFGNSLTFLTHVPFVFALAPSSFTEEKLICHPFYPLAAPIKAQAHCLLFTLHCTLSALVHCLFFKVIFILQSLCSPS